MYEYAGGAGVRRKMRGCIPISVSQDLDGANQCLAVSGNAALLIENKRIREKLNR
jgi:hypothetical protein